MDPMLTRSGQHVDRLKDYSREHEQRGEGSGGRGARRGLIGKIRRMLRRRHAKTTA